MESTVDKCLAFCQALIKSDQKFALNLSIGKDRFFFSNKELESSWKKKKKSPSQLQREENRKRNCQNKAAEEVADNGADEASAEKVEINSTAEKAEVLAIMSCKECGYKATTEKGLKQHERMKHKNSLNPQLLFFPPQRPHAGKPCLETSTAPLSPTSPGRRPATTVGRSSP